MNLVLRYRIDNVPEVCARTGFDTVDLTLALYDLIYPGIINVPMPKRLEMLATHVLQNNTDEARAIRSLNGAFLSRSNVFELAPGLVKICIPE